jgi:hypothetical protein
VLVYLASVESRFSLEPFNGDSVDTERILDVHPLDGMRSAPHAAVRMHAPVDHVRAILACARQQAIDAAIREGRRPSDRVALHRAEQTLLLTRLAADSGARRRRVGGPATHRPRR